MNKKLIFVFILIVLSVLLLFHKAFTINFFLDDFFFLKIGRADNVNQFLQFFSPFKNYFYRPLPTEVFYYFINLVKRNLIITHSFIFLFYFIGIFFLLKILLVLTKDKLLTYLIVFMYAINFIHVFQLYQVATFIEISLFTFLIISFFFVIKKNYLLSSVFFIGALLSKESALLFPLILILSYFFKIIYFSKKDLYFLIIDCFISIIFYFLYRPSVTYITATEPFYRLIWSPKLIINNMMWYGLWSFGLPNFLPNYLSSIFFKPLPFFWNLLNSSGYKVYFYSLIIYYSLFIPTALSIFLCRFENWKKTLSICLFIFTSFTVLILPTLPTVHRWMVRLTVPLIFIVIFQALIIYLAFIESKGFRVISMILLVLYILIQVTGIQIHESSSLFLFESKISNNVLSYFRKNEKDIKNKKIIYFLDRNSDLSGWGGSKKLKNTLHGENFIFIFFPNESKKIFYDFEKHKIPLHSYVIDSAEMMPR